MRSGPRGKRSSTLPVVLDASALVELLLGTPRAVTVGTAISGEDMVAPDLIDPEVLSVLRRFELSGQLATERAQQALDDLLSAPIRRFPTALFLQGAWALPANLSAYDACYVALASGLGCSLVTADRRLARAADSGTSVIVVG
jgi:predicted nucleic acid-binding protein